MKDYAFILRTKAVTTDFLAQVGPKWAVLIPEWIRKGHFEGNALMANEGHVINGKTNTSSNEPLSNDEMIVLDVLRMKAKDMNQALELAKLCPTLEFGGVVEVREVLPPPPLPVS